MPTDFAKAAAIGSTIFVVIPMIVSELTPQPQRAAMLAIVNSIMTLGGVIAPFAMGVVVQDAATRLAGYDNGFTILGGLSQRPLVQFFQPQHAYQVETIPGIKDMIAKFK